MEKNDALKQNLIKALKQSKHEVDSWLLEDAELSRIVGGKFDVKGFYEWGREIHPIVIAAEFGEPYDMEWGDYHRRGLEFAKELRKCLPSEYDLWYHKPFEDNTCSIPERQLIM
ncbi:MAG: hypothetical protein J6S16_03335 [Bacteroidales bacterium]|nr:hypothetical protein [Bacteroidales bacterium]